MNSSDYYGNMGVLSRNMVSAPTMMAEDFGTNALDSLKTSSGVSTDRYSETNVQVAGIDEPDIVKTDGQNIYYSKQPNYYMYERMMVPSNGILPYPQATAETDVIKSWPLSDMSLLAKIDKTGEILVKDNMLVVFSGREINSSLVSYMGKTVILSIARDITERKKLDEQITQLAYFDPLTKLPNRRLFDDRLLQAISASTRSACHGALMFIDLDNFKPLNDTHGHEAGDELLIEAARRIKACIRATDTVSRFGGDEFVVLINGLTTERIASKSEAVNISEKIRNALAEPYLLILRHGSVTDQTVEHQCTASIGVTLFSNHKANSAEIIKRADAAMYKAKQAGRNQIRLDEAY